MVAVPDPKDAAHAPKDGVQPQIQLDDVRSPLETANFAA